MKTFVKKLKRLSNPRVRRRLKIGLSGMLGLFLLGVSHKVVYDIGYFDARSLANTKITLSPLENPKLSREAAQRIVTAALKEDYGNPTTVVVKVVDDNAKLSTIIIEHNKQRNIAWIINMELFFIADIFNKEGLNITKGLEQHYEITHSSQ